jgi:flagellar hook protein FlgE
MDLCSIALQGLAQADAQLETAAARIAGANSPDGATLDVVDLSAGIVALMSAQSAFEVNLATLKTADQIQKSLIDIKT